MMREYKAALAGNPGSQIDIAFPDFPGCVSVADTISDAKIRASLVLAFHIEAMLADGEPLPNVEDAVALQELVNEYESEGFAVRVISVLVDELAASPRKAAG